MTTEYPGRGSNSHATRAAGDFESATPEGRKTEQGAYAGVTAQDAAEASTRKATIRATVTAAADEGWREAHTRHVARYERRIARLHAKLAGPHPVIVRGSDCVGAAIYGLIDPAEPERVRYVGKTRSPGSRLARHIVDSGIKNGAKDRWIRALLAAGRAPDMVLLERAWKRSMSRERYWVTELQERGQADLNTVIPEGGNDFPA